MTLTPTIKTLRFSLQSVLFSAIVVTGFGCAGADSLTYSKEAGRQGMKLYQDGDYVDASAAFASATGKIRAIIPHITTWAAAIRPWVRCSRRSARIAPAWTSWT